MIDDPKLAKCDTLVNVVIAEIKTSECRLNGPWTDRTKANMQRVLRAVGCVSESELEAAAAAALYTRGSWNDDRVTVRLFALGETRNPALPIPASQQVTWEEIISFCIDRFNRYKTQKSSSGQWKADGLQLKEMAVGRNANPEIRRAFGLTALEQQSDRTDD